MYPMRLTRLAEEALDSARTAKQDLVADQGIGSDLSPALFSWDDHNPTGWAILADPAPHTNGELIQLIAATSAIAQGWKATTIALTKEGYSAPRDANPDDHRSLAERFATDPTVNECINICVVDKHGNACFLVQPYKLALGRKVEWLEHDIVDITIDETPIAAMLHKALNEAGTLRYSGHPSLLPRFVLDALKSMGFAAMHMP